MRQRHALVLAMGLGFAALAVAWLIGLYAERSAFRAVARRQHEVFQSEVSLVAAAASMLPDSTPEERLRRIGETWNSNSLAPKEYLAVYDAQNALLYHSAYPETTDSSGSGGISLPGIEYLEKTRAAASLVSGGFFDTNGRRCMAAGVALRSPDWLFVVYYPRAEVKMLFWERILIVRWLYVVLCVGLMPASLLLMYITVRRSMRSALRSAKALQEAQNMLLSLMNASSDAAMLLDREGAILAMNESVANLFRRRPEELTEDNAFSLLPEPIATKQREQMQEIFQTGQPIHQEVMFDERRFYLSMNPVFDLSENVTRIAVFARDITERRNAEIALRRSEERFRKLAVHAPVGIFLVSADGECQYANDRWRIMSDMKSSDIRNIHWASRVHPDDRKRILAAWGQAVGLGEEFSEECRFLIEEDVIRWLACSAIALRDDLGNISGYLGTATDITDRRNAEENLRTSLQEKEVLLREIHHRVKNNLQIMASLLELQSSRIADPEVQALFADSRRRVRAMALLHEKLCSLNHQDCIDAREYFSALVEAVFSSFGARAACLVPQIDIVACSLDVDTAIPCGIILNELLSNALEHAFVESSSGRIVVRFCLQNEKYLLTVADDGRGLPAGINVENPSSLGLQLVRMLTLQLRGEMVCRETGGAEISIRFPKR